MPSNIYALEGSALNQVQRTISQKIFLKADINLFS
jgi:hypothetical protein